MDNIIAHLNPAFDHRNRLGIMSILMVNDWVQYKELKELLNLSDGNLASHIKALEKVEYIDIKKQFVGKKPQTTYAASETGKIAFAAHLNALEAILKMGKS